MLIVVLIAALTVLGLTFSYGRSGGSILNRLYTTLEKPMTGFGNTLKENFKGIFSYRDLLDENDRLKTENEELRREVNQLTLTADELRQLNELSGALNYDFVESEDDIVTANVVSLDGTNWMNAFTIDTGSEKGIAEDNVVLCGEGLLGRIAETGTGWSKVVPLIDESSRISFNIEGNDNLLGIIEGSENGTLSGYMLDSGADVSEGDVLVTSGMGRYPAGIIIGKISKAGYDSNKQLMIISVKSKVDFTSLRKVSVVL